MNLLMYNGNSSVQYSTLFHLVDVDNNYLMGSKRDPSLL